LTEEMPSAEGHVGCKLNSTGPRTVTVLLPPTDAAGVGGPKYWRW
jgi:hypothetical protein